MNKLLKSIYNSRVVKFPIEVSKKIILPGFDGVPLYDVIAFFFKGLQQNSLGMRASSVAFNFFLALFPFIIFLFSVIPYVPIDNFQAQLMALLSQFLPDSAFELAKGTIDDLVLKKHNTMLSIGFILTFYLSSNGVKSMIISFNESYHAVKKGSFIQNQLRALLLLLILTILMFTAIGLVVFSSMILDYFVAHGFLSDGVIYYVISIGKYIVLLLLFFLGISSIYYFGNVKGGHFRFISAGGTLTTLLSIALSGGFAFYVNNFANYNKVYGSIGALIVIMLWLYFNSLVLLIGYELNASIKHAQIEKYPENE